MRLSNKAWPWYVLKENDNFFHVLRWHRDNESLFFKTEDEAKNCAADLNLKDYGMQTPSGETVHV